MKTILCYGDSLTFGVDAENQGRHAHEDRWPSVIEAALAGKVRAIAEGLGGRTTAFDEYSAIADRNGVRVLPTLLGTHYPLDLVIVMLGTNDMKRFISGSALAAAHGMRRLVEIIRAYPYDRGAKVPEIILVAPPHCVETEHAELKPMFEGAIEESAKLAAHYKRAAKELGCAFFDASTVAKATPIDGVHLDAKNTRAIGEGLVPVVQKVLGI